jgi:hypothetical protein
MKPGFMAYPNKQVPALAMTYECIIKPTHPELLQWVHVNFKRVKKYMPEENKKNAA